MRDPLSALRSRARLLSRTLLGPGLEAIRRTCAPSSSFGPAGGWTPVEFLVGANLPWVSYGNDFGASAWFPNGGLAASAAGRAAADRALGEAAERGLEVVRWLVLCDGRAGIRFDDRGAPVGLDDRLPADLDAALDLARRRNLRLLLVLFDFPWCRPPRVVSGVQLGGRRDVIARRSMRRALAENVAAPLFEALGREPAVFGWDLCNEPEWFTWGFGGYRRDLVAPWAVRDWLAGLARLARRHARQPVTVGLADVEGLPLCRGLPLDFYQVHWYEHLEPLVPLERPVAAFRPDRPVLLGELPTRAGRSPAALLDAARGAGYAGALFWSLLARDPASSWAEARDRLRQGDEVIGHSAVRPSALSPRASG